MADITISNVAGDSTTEAAGSGAFGSTFATTYRDRPMEAIPVTRDELDDFKSAGHEEFHQFVIGEFLAAGSFWLGIERLITSSDVWKDVLFWVCVVSFICGIVILYFGLRQLRRRKNRIDRIIESASLRMTATNAT